MSIRAGLGGPGGPGAGPGEEGRRSPPAPFFKASPLCEVCKGVGDAPPPGAGAPCAPRVSTGALGANCPGRQPVMAGSPPLQAARSASQSCRRGCRGRLAPSVDGCAGRLLSRQAARPCSQPALAGSLPLQAACPGRQPAQAGSLACRQPVLAGGPSCRRGCRGCLVRAVACIRGCHEVAKGGSGVGEGGGQEPWRRGRRQTSSTPSWGTRLKATPEPCQKIKLISRV